MKFDWTYFWESLFLPSPRFLEGLGLTVGISVVAMALALVVGLLIALMGRSKFAPFKIFASLYIWVVRGTPLLVQLVIIYTGLAAAGVYRFEDADIFGAVIRGAVQAAVIGLMINESAYIAEIVRSGLESVDRGQDEAALSLGMTPMQSMRQIIVPQAVRIMVPPLGNSFNGLLKSTSILSIIGVAEMFQAGATMSSASFKTFEIYIVVALYYLAITTIWTFIQTAIENTLNDRAGYPRAESVLKKLFGYPTKRSKQVAAPAAPELETARQA